MAPSKEPVPKGNHPFFCPTYCATIAKVFKYKNNKNTKCRMVRERELKTLLKLCDHFGVYNHFGMTTEVKQKIKGILF